MRHWLEDEPAELRAFLASLPKDSLSEHPATELLAAVLGSTTAPMDDRVTERTMRRAVLDEDDELALLAHLLTAMQSRRRGELAPARRQLMLARPILARLEAGLMSTAAPLTTFARAQFALTALAAGELASAHAWIESGPAPTSPPLRSLARLTPALTAMIAAINGDMIAARGSLQRCQHAAPSTGWTAEIADGAAHLASLIIATEEWRFDDAEHLVRSHNPASFGELWPVAYWAHANYLMVRGRDQQALRLAQQALLAEPPGARGDGFARDLLVGTRVEFLIALGELRAAWTLGGEAGEEGPVRTIASIGVLYRSGEFGVARFLARALRNRFHLSVRQSVQVRALEGAAAIAEGDKVAAQEAVRTVLELLDHHDLGSTAVQLPAPLIGLIRGQADAPLPQLGAMARLGLNPRLEGPLVAAPLSPRERAVLSQLAEARSRAAIAESLGVSINTVKTQVQSIYRKFGVASARDLLDRLRELPPIWVDKVDADD